MNIHQAEPVRKVQLGLVIRSSIGMNKQTYTYLILVKNLQMQILFSFQATTIGNKIVNHLPDLFSNKQKILDHNKLVPHSNVETFWSLQHHPPKNSFSAFSSRHRNKHNLGLHPKKITNFRMLVYLSG